MCDNWELTITVLPVPILPVIKIGFSIDNKLDINKEYFIVSVVGTNIWKYGISSLKLNSDIFSEYGLKPVLWFV